MVVDENAHYGFGAQGPNDQLHFSTAMSWPVQQQQQQQQHHHHHHHPYPPQHLQNGQNDPQAQQPRHIPLAQPQYPTHHHHQPHPYASLSASSAMSPKQRSTSPLPLALDTQSFRSNAVAATFPGTAVAMAAAQAAVNWPQMTSQASNVLNIDASYPSSQPFDPYSGTSFQASPTDIAPAPSGFELDAQLQANLQFDGYNMQPSSLGAAIPTDVNDINYERMSEDMSRTDSDGDTGSGGNLYDISGSSSSGSGGGDLLGMEQPSISMPGFSDADFSNPDFYTLQHISMQVTSPSQSAKATVGSPCGTHISEGSNSSWTIIEPANPQAIFGPHSSDMHVRSLSESSSNSDSAEQHSRASLDGYVEVNNVAPSPSTYVIASSPSINSALDLSFPSDHESHFGPDSCRPSPPAPAPLPISSNTLMANHSAFTNLSRAHVSTGPKPLAIKPQGSTSSSASSPQHSPTSPVTRKPTYRKPAANKSAQNGVHKTPASRVAPRGISPIQNAGTKDQSEKRIGRRKGPLRPDQRKQAGEIRKLGACIRCRFLKKTCDKGDPCGGCQPSHARLWLVPCTRVDIRDLGYFMKDWKADYERHVSLGVSVGNIKGFSDREITLWITHGYGQFLPVQARQIHVRDDRVFGVNWVESRDGEPKQHEVDTAKLSAGQEGVSTKMLSDYLDRLIDNNFPYFVDEHFEGTPFVTDILKTAHRYSQRAEDDANAPRPVRRALKFVLAYNLTQAVCMAKFLEDDDEYKGEGVIEDHDSYYRGQTAAPVMINFQVKCAMADMWRELQKEILEELSTLYSSFYSPEKLKHWPTIFMLASILLIIWEEMQFDCRYRVPDAAVVEKFCNDMETTPVGVIVGLFSAISTKVPSFSEWDTSKHHTSLNSNRNVCIAMEEVRDNVNRWDDYLRGRSQAHYDRNDFDSLSNKFLSKLVIRAH